MDLEEDNGGEPGTRRGATGRWDEEEEEEEVEEGMAVAGGDGEAEEEGKGGKIGRGA